MRLASLLDARRSTILSFAGMFGALMAWAACGGGRPQAPGGSRALEAALADYGARLDSLDASLDTLDRAIRGAARRPVDEAEGAKARVAFRAARVRFKRVEMQSEYYVPWLSREINGPVLTRADEDDPETPVDPAGFQVIEATLFPSVDVEKAERALVLVHSLRGNVASLRSFGVDTMPGDAFFFDAARQEIARVATLGIAGFDAAVSRDAMTESADALQGVRDALAPWTARLSGENARLADALDARFAEAIAELRANPDFDTFDRLHFIVHRVQPLAHTLALAQRALGIGAPDRPRAWSHHAASIFDRDAIDPAFFAPAEAVSGAAVAALGRSLFFDPALSPSGTRSCASCHDPAKAFTDARPRPLLLESHQSAAPRNTPGLIGVALQPALFADERAHFLEDQITDVLGSRAEMGGSLEAAAGALRARSDYRARFADAFHVAPDSGVTGVHIRLAIAAYLRTLRGGTSRVDRALAGDSSALAPRERDGFNLFVGRAGCGTCHFAPAFGGAMPPALAESEPEVLGVPARWAVGRRVLDPDPGRWGVRRTATNHGAFKTPTLRNVARTAPYMHNGAFATLEAVLDFYDAGGGAGIGLAVPNQTLPADSLHLTRGEKLALIAFMRALTDTGSATARSGR